MKNEKKTITMRIDDELLKKIENDAEKNERDRTKQIAFMLKKYYEIMEEFRNS